MQNNTVQFGAINQNTAANMKYGRLIQYALIMISTAPIILVYPFMQKHFIKGVMIGSIKE